MKYINALFLSVAALTEAFIVPELNNGMYLGAFDPQTGELTSELVKMDDKGSSKLSSTASRSPYGNLPSSYSPSTTKREVVDSEDFAGYTVTVEKTCNSGDVMDLASEFGAWETAGASCENPDYSVNGRYVQVYINGDSAWYICNYSGNPQGFSGSELSAARDDLEVTCGSALGTGYVYVEDWDKMYGRAKVGQSICGRTTGAEEL